MLAIVRQIIFVLPFVFVIFSTNVLNVFLKSPEYFVSSFGLLFGLGVFALYQKEGASFLPKYDAMLASCGSGTIAEVAASVGIDVRSVDYWRSALDVVRGEVDEFVKLCK